MSNNTDTTIYVVAETRCRGDVEREKFTIPLSVIQQAVAYHALSQDERDAIEPEIDSFIEMYDPYIICSFISCLIEDDCDIENKLRTEGKVIVEGEESSFGCGTTEELAMTGYLELYPISFDNW